jgi:4-hydroxy-tetrahydrodipicolinate reductase
MIRVCVAGATGWVGRSLVPELVRSEDCELASAVSRTHSGQAVASVFGLPNVAINISGSIEDALELGADVLVDFTRPNVVLHHVNVAIEKGLSVVIGTSGITDEEYDAIDERARAASVGVLAGGNFAITAVLLQRFATMAARFVPHWEIIDYAHADKVDAPSGTTRELAYRLSEVGHPKILRPVEEIQGLKESRGAEVNRTRIHSVRLPGFIISAEAIFGLPSERLSIRHDAGSDAAPYVGGTMLAIRKVQTFVGLKRGLDSIMDFNAK